MSLEPQLVLFTSYKVMWEEQCKSVSCVKHDQWELHDCGRPFSNIEMPFDNHSLI